MLSVLQLGSLLLGAVNALAATVVGKDGTLTLTSKAISPDGWKRNASVVNDVHPGPLVAISKGDSVSVNVVNELDNPSLVLGTSIHWHGMFQRRTNFMDGTDGVTQCPIAPGNSFRYTFDTDQTGTFWYHSHFGEQYCDGVRGAFVIYDPDDPLKEYYDVDDESTVITLTEWYHTPVEEIPGLAMPDATLINGKGRFVGGPQVDLAVTRVEQWKRYRFRLLSMSCEPAYNFSIDGHDLTVIEADGVETRPYTINSIQILAGQRYSFVLNANQTVDNYWMRALPNFGNNNSTFEGGVNLAILRYSGAENRDPTTEQQKKEIPLLETELHPAVSSPAPGKATPDGVDADFTFTFGFNETAFKFNINGSSYAPPSVPVLLQILSGAQAAQDLLPQGSVYEVERNKTVQINMPSDLIGGPHPFHMHGHTFWVIKSGDSFGEYNYEDPVIRDVVSAGNTPGDFVSIRFRTDNPGPWLFHCHINPHLQAGLAVVFAEAKNQTRHFQESPPAEWNELCKAWDALDPEIQHAGNNSLS